MPKVGGNKFETTRNSVFGQVIDSAISGRSPLVNFIEFIEGDGGPGLALYPMQRVIGKAVCGVPMDYKEKTVPLWDKYRETLLGTYKETEILHILHDQGKCNFDRWEDLPPEGFSETGIFVGRRGGKALDVNELIPTPDRGFVPIGDLKENELVFGPDGKPTRIKYAFDPFYDQTYEVCFNDGTSVVTHGEHNWFTYTKHDRRKLGRLDPSKAKHPKKCHTSPIGGVRTTLEIMKTLKSTSETTGKFEFNHWIPLCEPVELPEKDLPLDPYYLGIWLGDGSHKSTAVTTMDPEVVKFLQDYASSLGLTTRPDLSSNQDSKATSWGMKSIERTRRGWAKTELDNNVVRRELCSLGVWGNKHIPDQYLWGSIEQRTALLQGLMDSDGWCTNGRSGFANTNRNLIDGVYHLAASLGLKPSKIKPKLDKDGNDYCWSTTWTSPTKVFRLPRKLDKLKTDLTLQTKYRTIVDVKPLDTRKVRCISVDREDGLFLFGKNFNITHNSELIAAISLYKLYRLLSIVSPHEYYGLFEGSPIDITFMAQDDGGAGRLFNKFKAGVNKTGFFTPYIRKTPNKNDVAFVTESDRHKRDVIPSITAAGFPCTTNAVRGPSSIVLCLDEFAHFRSNLGSNSDDIYEAATPAAMQFVTPEGKIDSLIMMISSPWKKAGKAYDIHKTAMEEGSKSKIFTVRLSTAEMNIRASSEFLRQKEKTSSLTWKAEYGGEFLDGSGSYIEPNIVDQCVDTQRGNIEQFKHWMVGRKFFWGMDVGFKGDGTTLAVSHWEMVNKGFPMLVVDYLDRKIVGVEPYEDVLELPLDEVIDWFSKVNNLLPGFRGVVDQHGGSIFKQVLIASGLSFMDYLHLNEYNNSEMYLVLRGLMDQRRIRLPNNHVAIQEVKNLELTLVAQGRVKVEAPKEKGAHDDYADAIALSAYQANKWLLEALEKAKVHGMDFLEIEMAPTSQTDPSLEGLRERVMTDPTSFDIDDLSMRQLTSYNRMSQMKKSQLGGGFAGGTGSNVSNRHRQYATSSKGRKR